MSKTIDQRVVEMQFDNKNFEKNVSQSMSTLDKLKEKLDFKKASKSLDELNDSVKNTDMSPLGKALDIGAQKFSALEQIGIGALRKIGEEAVETGKKLLKALSVDNISAGWNKFGEETMAVATLSAQGYDLDLIYDQLEKLNFFTDETSYNFTDMVKEIGKFTAAGQDLEASVIAMEGIATWAALSGQNASTASRAMYQLSQAMGAGVMRREDYRSIQNVSMDTREFRQQAINAALALGTLKRATDEAGKAIDGMYVSAVNDRGAFDINQFAEHLTEDAWFTSDVMMMVYRDFGKAANTLEKYMTRFSLDTASEAMDDLKGKATELADEMVKLGEASDFDSAYNAALENISLDALEEIPELAEEATKFIESYNKELDETGSSAPRLESVRDALVEMGYGLDSLSLKAFEAGQAARTWTDVIESVKDAVSTGWSRTFRSIIGDQEEATKLFTRFANDFWDLFASGGGDRNKALGFWREYVDAGTGAVIDGRELLFGQEEGNLGAVIQLLQNLKDLLQVIKDAWNETFYGTTDADTIAQKKADILMSITKALKAVADWFAITEEKADKLKRTFKGLFSIFGIIKDFIGAGLNAIFRGLSSVLGDVNIDIWEFTANIGDSITAFRKFLQENKVFEKFFGGIGTVISTVINWIKSFIDTVKELPFVKAIIDWLANAFNTLSEAIGNIFEQIGKGKSIGEIFQEMFGEVEFFQKIGEAFGYVKDMLVGFWNVVKSFFAGGKDAAQEAFDGMSGTFEGIKNWFKSIFETIKGWLNSINDFLLERGIDIKGALDKIREYFSNLTMDDIFRIGASIALFMFVRTLLKSINDISRTVSGLEKLVDSFKLIVNSLTGVFKSIKGFVKAHTLQIMAGAILALVAAIAVLAFIDPERVITATAAVAALAIVLTIMMAVASKMKGAAQAAIIIASLASALGILVVAVSLLAKGDSNQAIKGLLSLTLICGLMLVIVAIVSRIMSKKAQMKSVAVVGLLMLEFALSILLLTAVVKKLQGVDPKGLDTAKDLLWSFVGMIAVIMLASSLGGKVRGAGNAVLGMVIGLYLILGSIRKLGEMDLTKCYTGLTFVQKIFRMFSETLALINIAGIGGKGLKGSGGAILAMIVGLWAIIGAIMALGNIPAEKLNSGMNTIRNIMLVMALVIAASHFAGEHAKKAGVMLLMMSLAIGILSAFVWALSGITDTKALIAATASIATLMLLMAAIVAIAGKSEKGIKVIQKITSVIVALGTLLFLMSMFGDFNRIIAAAAGMTAVMLSIMGIMIVASRLKEAPKGLGGTIVAIIGMLVAVSSAIAILATLPMPNDVIRIAGAISIVMAGLAVAMLVIGKIKNSIGEGVVDTLLTLTVAILAIGGILTFMSYMDVQNGIQNAGSIAILLLALSVGARILGQINKENVDWNSVISTMGAMLIAFAAVAAVMSAIEGFGGGNIQMSIQNAGAMSILLLALAGCSLVLGKIKGNVDWNSVIKTMGAMLIAFAAVALVMSLIEGIGGGNIQMSIQNAAAMSTLLLALAAGAVILGYIPPAASFGPIISALGAMLIALVAVGALAAALAGLDILMNGDLEYLLEKGFPILNRIALGLGEVVGNLIGGLLSGIANGILQILPAIGMAIEDMMGHLNNAFANVDDSVFANMESLARAILMITASELIDGIAHWLGMDTSDLVPIVENLGKAVLAFNAVTENEISDPENIKKVAEAAAALATAATSMPTTGGILHSIIGETKDLGTFSEELVTLAPNLVEYGNRVKDLDDSAVQKSAAALQMLADVANSLPKTDGLWQGLTGTAKSVDSFILEFKRAAPNLVKYAEEVKPLDTDSVEKSAAAMNILSTMAKKLPKHDGLAQWFTGDATLTSFAEELDTFGPSIVSYSKTVRGVDKTAVEKSAIAGQTLAKVKDSLPEEPAFWGIFGGGKDMDGFSEGLGKLAEGLVNFSDIVSGKKEGYNKVDSDTVNTAASALGILAEVQNSIGTDPGWIAKLFGGGGGPDWGKFKEGMPKLAEAVQEFSKALTKDGGIDTTAVSAAGDLMGAISGIGNLTINGGSAAQGIDFAIEKLPKVADAIAKFSEKVTIESLPNVSTMSRIKVILQDFNWLDSQMEYTGYDNLNGAMDAFGDLMYVLADVSGLDIEKINAFGAALKEISDSGFKDMMVELAKTDVQNDLVEAASSLFGAISTGIGINETPVAVAANDLIQKAIDTMVSRNADLKNAGSDAGAAVVNGYKEATANINTSASSSGFEIPGLDINAMLQNGATDFNYQDYLNQYTGGIATAAESPETKSALQSAGASAFGSFMSFDMNALNWDDLTGGFIGGTKDAFSSTDVIDKVKDVGGDFFGNMLNIDTDTITKKVTDSNIMGKMANVLGVNIGTTEVTEALKSDGSTAIDAVVDGAVTEISSTDNKVKVEECGKNFIQGFIDGMETKKKDSNNKAFEIGKAAVDNLKKSIDAHSPSKETYQLGDYFGIGFVNALGEYVNISYRAAGEVGASATDGLRDAMAKSASLFDTSVDMQPTIKPVIDLTDVNAGISRMDGMFEASRSIAFAGDINATMNANGGDILQRVDVDNSNVVDAIGGLKDEMGVMADSWSKMQVVMSSGELVGALAAPMDTALGKRTIRQGRG
jgi:hypothetical protein